MNAGDVMTTKVVSVGPDAPTAQIARLLLQHRISALPVIDRGGELLGMVSEGDLIGRNDAEREARRDWWLALLAEGGTLSEDFLATIRSPSRTAAEVMSKPVVSVSETTDVSEVARLLGAHRIKRVAVVRAGSVVGIVSRADLLGALAGGSPPAIPLQR